MKLRNLAAIVTLALLALSPAFPDTIPLVMTVRDFSMAHPDFEPGGVAAGDSVRKGMVLNTLGPDGKPVKGPTPHFQSAFGTWFNTDTANGNVALRNYETCRDLPLSKRMDGRWEYDSYGEASHSFFPIDDFNRFAETSPSMYVDSNDNYHTDPTGAQHNFSFCLELHAEFEHEPGRTFELRGDDDIWVYINNKLALDLGGIHTPRKGSINFNLLGLTPGQVYPFDFFYCERQSQGSDLRINTSLNLFQPSGYILWVQSLGGGAKKYSLKEIVSTASHCGPPESGDTLPAPSRIQLQGPSLISPPDLAVGTSYGGISLNSARTELTLDTSKITGLRPGRYVLNAISDRSGKVLQVSFTISSPVHTSRSAGKVGADLQALVRGDQVMVGFKPGMASPGALPPQLTIASIDGAVVYRKRMSGLNGFTDGFTESLKAADIGSGLHLISVTAGNRQFVRRILIP